MRRVPLVVLAAVVLVGCAGVRVPVPALDDAARAGEVVVIRPSGFLGCGARLTVAVDGVARVDLACGEHVVLPVDTGERIVGVRYWLMFSEAENTTTVALEAGRRAYLRLDVPGFSGPVLNRVGENAARPLMEKTTPVR